MRLPRGRALRHSESTSTVLTSPTETTMNERCGCGHEAPSELALFGCFDCGTTCCRDCTIHLESATYCHACAGSLLDTAAVRSAEPFELH